MNTINPICSSWKIWNGKGQRYCSQIGDVEATRDYAEILKFEFDNEIISEHFVNSWLLSIKVCSAQFVPNSNNTELKKKQPQHAFTHAYLMDQIKM